MKLSHPLDEPIPGLPKTVRLIAGWTAVWIVASTLDAGRLLLAGRPLDPLRVATDDLPILLAWLLCTPLVFAVARRWPLQPRLRRLLLHAGAGTVFVALTNLAIRLPLLVGEGGVPWARESALAITRYLPPALLLYLGLVWMATRETRDEDTVAEDPTTGASTLAFRAAMRTHLLETSDISWIEADNNHVKIHRPDGRPIRVRRRLSELERSLGPRGFVRIHRSTLARVGAIREVQPLGKGDFVAVLRDGTELRVARSRRTELEGALGIRL